MTPTTASKFRSLTHILSSQGFNLWDARIEARRLLGIKLFEQRDYRSRVSISSRLAFRLNDNDRNRPENIPTDEDRLDVYFNSIVASCRSVVFGTVMPRSFSEFSHTWQDAPADKRNTGRYSLESAIVTKGKQRSYKPVCRPKGYWHMVRLLEANGLTLDVAKEKAQSILIGN